MSVLKFIIESSKELRGFIIGMFICILIIAVDSNIRPYIIKLLIDQSSHFSLNTFTRLSLYYIASQMLMVIANSMCDWFGTRYHTRYRAAIAHHFVNQLTKYSYRFFQETQAGSITSRISDAFNTIPIIVFTTIRWFIHFILLTLIAITVLSQVSYLFALAVLAWIGIFLILTIIFYKKYEPLNADYATSRPKIYGFLSDYFANILSVWCFSNKQYEKERFLNITSEFMIKSTRCGDFLRKFYAMHGIIVAIYMSFILILLGYLSIKEIITAGDFALVFMVNYKIVDALFDISNMSREFVTNCGIVANSIKILNESIEIIDQPNAKPLTMNFNSDNQHVVKTDNTHQSSTLHKFTKVNSSRHIVLENVGFHYKGVDILFNNLSVTIERGQKVGLVGYSGGGKSTFVNLILRLYEVTKGRILIDDQDIRTVTQDSLRAAIGMIPQDTSLFNRTLYENIRYGRIDATDEEVIAATKKAYAHEFISKLPKTYESLVGERGIKLSGGQRQRIAIARAILKNAPILILDEATSQLDSITESDIQESLWKLMQEKTTIVIAHRLSTLLKMDRILVLEQSKIVEDGTHQELLAKGQIYKTLWDAQIGGFLPYKKIQ